MAKPTKKHTAKKPALHGIEGGLSPEHPSRHLSLDPADAESLSALSDFIIPGQDSHGHSAPLPMRVPPSLLHEMDSILQSKLYPWQTRGEMARWCLHRGMQELAKDRLRRDKQAGEEGDPIARSLASLLATWVAAAKVQQEHLKFADAFKEIEAVLDGLLESGAIGPARRMCKEMQDAMRGIDDVHWQGRFRELVTRSLGVIRAMERYAEEEGLKEDEGGTWTKPQEDSKAGGGGSGDRKASRRKKQQRPDDADE